MEMKEFVQGSCMTKCPKQEIEMRESERLLHRLEMLNGTENNKYPKADPNRTVKSYSRSAASVNMAVTDLIRPFNVLKQTVMYLVSEALNSVLVSELSAYNFVWDRLRSVRQDMTIQALPPQQCVQLLEPMVLFHTIYGYKLCQKSRDEYDPVLNKKQLLECLKQLLVCYDSINSDFVTRLSQMTLKDPDEKSNEHIQNNRHLMESLYILTNINDIDPLRRYLNLPELYRINQVKLSYKISIEILRNNFARACRLAKKLTPAELCSFSIHLPHIHKKVLEIYSRAYDSKHLTFPCTILAECFMFNSTSDVKSIASFYGLKSCNNEILFNKSDFKDNKLLQPTKICTLEEPNISKLSKKMFL